MCIHLMGLPTAAYAAGICKARGPGGSDGHFPATNEHRQVPKQPGNHAGETTLLARDLRLLCVCDMVDRNQAKHVCRRASLNDCHMLPIYVAGC